MATVPDSAVPDTVKVNFQQIKTHLKKKKLVFSSLRPKKIARKSHYLFKRNLCLGKSPRTVMICCHPIR